MTMQVATVDICTVFLFRTDVILFVLNAETGEVQLPEETIR